MKQNKLKTFLTHTMRGIAFGLGVIAVVASVYAFAVFVLLLGDTL